MTDLEEPTAWAVTVDCHDAPAQARFWALALGYVPAPPPTGWDSWQQWARDHAVSEDQMDDGATICDPTGVRPVLSFLRVPEGKTVKNRLHLDLKVSGGRHVDQGLREERIRAAVRRLVAAGAAVLREDDGPQGLDHMVLQDPEGNEMCIV